MVLKLVLVGLGGGIGSILRYSIGILLHGVPASGFPFGTLIINLAGCAGIGVAAGLVADSRAPATPFQVALVVGVLGGFTTFSTFGWETFALFRSGRIVSAILYVSLSNGLGLLAVWAGYLLGLRLAER